MFLCVHMYVVRMFVCTLSLLWMNALFKPNPAQTWLSWKPGQEEPCMWAHANLAEIKAFLRDRIEDGTFKPLFPWDDDEGYDERLNNVC